MQYWAYNHQRGWTVYDHKEPTAFCPICQAPAYRVPRRPIDRLISRFFPQRRYQCGSADCGWKGNLSKRTTGADDELKRLK